MKSLVNQFQTEIRNRTRSGKGVSKDGSPAQALKPLKQSYVKQRENLQKKGRLASSTSPSKSNLTQSGEMLDDLTSSVRVTSAGIEGIIEFNSTDNAKKAGYAAEDRPFMNLSDQQMKKLEDEALEAAYEEAKRVIKSIK